MGLGDLRVALYAAYVALLLWRGRGGVPDDWWEYLILFAAVDAAMTGAAVLYERWLVRRAVRVLRGLDPAHRDERLQRIWMSDARRYLADRVAAEGVPERQGSVERFPFAHSDRRENTLLFWALALGAAVPLALLLARPPEAPTVGWTGWWVAVACLVGLTAVRRRGRHLTTTLEITPFAVAELGAGGHRRALRWGQALVLRNRPWRRRLELSAAGHPDFIALDYERVGFERVVRLVLEYGGFDTGAVDTGAAAS